MIKMNSVGIRQSELNRREQIHIVRSNNISESEPTNSLIARSKERRRAIAKKKEGHKSGYGLIYGPNPVIRQLTLNKGDQKYIYRYTKGDEVEAINNLVMQAYKSRTNSEENPDFDFFDAAVLAYKILEIKDRLQDKPDDLTIQSFKAVLGAIDCALEIEKYGRKNLTRLTNSFGDYVMREVGVELRNQEKRIDILCNDLVPYVKKYFAKIRKLAA